MRSAFVALQGFALAGFSFLLAVAPLGAQESETQIRIARLISRLGSASYLERSGASEELAGMGSETQAQLEKASQDADPEIRMRAKELLERLKVLRLWSATRVQYRATGAPASKALAAVAEQTGNRVLLGDQYGSFHDRDVNLDYADGTFWEIVDDVCRQSDNHVRPHYDTRSPGLVVVSGDPGSYPVAYSGPVRAQITSARRVFTEELDYEDLDSEQTHTFQLNLQMMWEDRFNLVAYRSQPQLVAAVTDTQAELSATHPAGSGWNVAGSSTRQLTMNLRLHPPATNAKQLDTLSLKWGLIAVGDMAEINVEDLTSTKPHYRDDVELVVDEVQQGPGPRCEVRVTVIRDLVVPEPQEMLFQECSLELFDEKGNAYRSQGQTNSLTSSGANMKVTFLGESSTSTPKTLRFTYPRIRAEKDLEIVFRNVPLPTGRPD